MNPYVFPIKGDISRADAVVLYQEAMKSIGPIFEYGVGGSTIFLGMSGKHVFCFEDVQRWIDRVKANVQFTEAKYKTSLNTTFIKMDYNLPDSNIKSMYNHYLPTLVLIDSVTKARPRIFEELMQNAQGQITILIHDTKDPGYLKPLFPLFEKYVLSIESIDFHYRDSNMTRVITKSKPVKYVNWNDEEKGNFRLPWDTDEV